MIKRLLWINPRLGPLRRTLTDFRLDSKLVIILILLGMIGFFGIFAGLASIITPSFAGLERAEVRKHVDRTNAALDEFSIRVETTVKDYGAWNESYHYLLAPTPAFETDTFSVLAMSNLDVNGMAYVRNDGTILFSRWVDLEKELEVSTLARNFDEVIRSPNWIAAIRARKSIRTYARIGGKIAAISAAQVFRTDGSGTATGFVVMARELNSAQLSALLQLNARIALSDRKAASLIDERDERLDISVNIDGFSGTRVGQAKFSLDRRLSALGQQTLLLAALCSAIGLLLVLLALRVLMRRLVIAPMRRVEQHMLAVSSSGSLSVLEGYDSQDEIGSLVRNLNYMLRQLKDLRERLEIQSFKLGRTESAVGVMHNVRNGLNPISVILSRAIQNRPVVSIEDANRAIEELEKEDVSADRRAKLSHFLKTALAAQVNIDHTRNEEMETARACLAQVVDLIGKQQATAHDRIDTEPCEIADVVRQNAALAQFSSNGKIRFAVAEGAIEGCANRLLLSQVVGNLFSNATESISVANRGHGLIEVTFSETADLVSIHVRDNGEGFDQERSKQFFERGFSSRKEKSGGLGLHWCANALSLMSGNLSLTSDGLGLGATATVTLPKSDRAEQMLKPLHPSNMSAPNSEHDNDPEVRVLEMRNRQ
jgi:sensor domain CHASE-containing protein